MRRNREPFFSLPALILMGALISLALYLLYPRQSVFEDQSYLEKPDALSIAYLEVLLRSDSDNVRLRVILSKALVASGQLDRAAQVLTPLLEGQLVPEEVFEYYLELQGQRLFAVPEGPQRKIREEELYTASQKLIGLPYEPERILELLMLMADRISQPRYLSLLKGMQQRMTRPEHQLQLAREIARLQEALAEPGAAADTLRPHIATVDASDRIELLNNIIRLELASGNPEAALALFKQVIPVRNPSEQALTEGIRLARLAGSATEEAAWVQQRADRNPGNAGYQRELLAFQLASGNVADALNTVRRLQNTPARLTRKDRQTIAEVLEWNELPADALPVWVEIYRETGSERAFLRSVDLARGLFQWEILLDLLTAGADQKRLQPDEYVTLADALVRNGRLDAARDRLMEGRIAHPGSVKLTGLLLVLLIDMRDFPAAITLLENQPDISDADRLQLASLYWRTRQPERALEVLDFQPADPVLAESVQIMRLQLATSLGQTAILRRDYDRLSTLDESELAPAIQGILLTLAVLFEDYPLALRLSKNRYRETGDPRFLAAIAEYQLALGQWPELEDTLKRWHDETPDALQNPRYWSLLALAHHRNDRIPAANEAYRNAWDLAPDDETLMISWAWLKLANPGIFADSLQALLARIGTNPSDNAVPVLAYGYSSLGQPRQALHWFRQGMSTRSNDFDWLVATATMMEQTGSPGTATNLRQKAADRLQELPSTPANRFAIYREEGLLRLAWQELAAFSRTGAGDANQDGFRESLAYFTYGEEEALVTEALIPQPSPETQGERTRITQLLHPPTENRPQQADRYLRQIGQISNPMAAEPRRETTRDTVNLHQNLNRAIQLGSRWQNLGNFTVQHSGITSQFSHDEFRWQLSASTLKANTSGRLIDTPGRNSEASITVDRRSGTGIWSVSASQLPRYQTSDTALAASYNWQWTDRIGSGAGYHFQERTTDSAEAWWLTRRNRAFVSAGYTPFSRLSLNAQAEQMIINSLEGDALADGYGLDLNATYTIFRNDPAWTVSTSYRNQQLSLANTPPAATLQALDQPLTTGELLTEEYERIGVSTRWFHGEPHALYRSTPSPRAFLALDAGYVLSTSQAEVGVELGLGWRILGDDEVALSGRRSSDGLDGNGRTEFNLTYTVYLGR